MGKKKKRYQHKELKSRTLEDVINDPNLIGGMEKEKYEKLSKEEKFLHD